MFLLFILSSTSLLSLLSFLLLRNNEPNTSPYTPTTVSTGNAPVTPKCINSAVKPSVTRLFTLSRFFNTTNHPTPKPILINDSTIAPILVTIAPYTVL